MSSRTTILPKLPLMFQRIGDVDLPYLVYDGGPSVVILIHATGFLPWLWHPVARELSPARTVIAHFIGDYRKADPEKGGLLWATIAQDIITFCERNNIEKPLLVGHSMGGTVLTIAHAHCGLDAQGMILIEPIFLPEDFYRIHFTIQDHPLAVKALKRSNQWKNASEAMEYLKSRDLFKNWNEEILELYVHYGMKAEPGGDLHLVCSPHTEAALFMGGVHFSPWPLLPKVSCPVLLVEGGTSDSTLFTNLDKALPLFTNASHVLVKDAGHLIPMEKPAEISAIINDFLRSISV